MQHYHYLIVGGGMTADAAVQGIREVDQHGPIGLVSAESDPPYERPPLTKGLWKDKPFESIWRKTQQYGAQLHLGRNVQKLDIWRRQATDHQGDHYTFEKLLLATGGRPRQLPFGDNCILYYRTAADYRRLRTMANNGRRLAVLGGGFIGSEIAAALAMNGKDVLMLFPGPGIGARVYPPELSEFLTRFYREKGVEVMPGETAMTLTRRGERLLLKTIRGRTLEVDGVVAGLGIDPNTDLAEQAGLRVENGIVVDEFLRTSHPHIYAAGDVAAFYNPALRQRLRVEHEDNANTMGRSAGRNIAGNESRYDHLPFFYSDLFELGYEAVGRIDSRLPAVADWQEPFRQGVIYYHRDGQVQGVLLWNVYGQVEAARHLIAGHHQFQPRELNAALLKAA